MKEDAAVGKPAMDEGILLLISEPVVRHVIQEVLEGAGYVVMATGDLGTAVDRIHDGKPDLLIIAPYVESITGYAAAKYLETHSPGMRILIVAGLLADDRLEYRAELERFDIFPKPFTATELLDKVRQVFSERR
jgi:DNA-binding NtrC family response regulator